MKKTLLVFFLLINLSSFSQLALPLSLRDIQSERGGAEATISIQSEAALWYTQTGKEKFLLPVSISDWEGETWIVPDATSAEWQYDSRTSSGSSFVNNSLQNVTPSNGGWILVKQNTGSGTSWITITPKDSGSGDYIGFVFVVNDFPVGGGRTMRIEARSPQGVLLDYFIIIDTL